MKTLTILFVAAIMMGVGCSKSEDSENNPDKPDKPSPLPDLPDPMMFVLAWTISFLCNIVMIISMLIRMGKFLK